MRVLLPNQDCGQMIKYTIKNRRIELTYETGRDFKIIKNFLELIDIINERKK